jgi:adenylylsulfate kinase-like enzyme
MNAEELKIKETAIAFARADKKRIAREATNKSVFPSDTFPVSVFMAGSPGAGKTESSKELFKKLAGNEKAVLRIDPDDLREKLPGYNGKNSYLFQGPASILTDKIQDYAIKQNQSYIFDGTLTNLDAARKNIRRCISHDRFVQIVYVYQDPYQAWKFVQARALKDGRVIPREVFVEEYFLARANVNILKAEFKKKYSSRCFGEKSRRNRFQISGKCG